MTKMLCSVFVFNNQKRKEKSLIEMAFLLVKGKQRIDGYFMRGNQKNIKNTLDSNRTCSLI